MKPLPVLLACVLLWPLSVSAQSTDPFTSPRVHIGPFAVAPLISITNVGVDTNVFNELDNPKSDFTATITPAAGVGIRLGRARVDARLSGSYFFFAKYAEERSLGTNDRVRLEFDLLHVTPWAETSFLWVRDRPTYEIDLRLRRTEKAVSGGVDFSVSKRTTLGFSLRRVHTDYVSGNTSVGSSVAEALTGTTTVETASVRYALTPLTTLVMAADVVRDRFEFSSERDSDSLRVMPGVELAASALISGSARVGYRHLSMLTPGIPDYTGPVAAVNIGYTLMGVTRFTVAVNRDVQYSYDPEQPYYLLTGVTASVSQAVGGPWSVNARTSLQRLAYQAVELLGLPGRVDVVRSYGVGAGYRLGSATTLGFNVDYFTRQSALDARQYRGLRAGSSITYGF